MAKSTGPSKERIKALFNEITMAEKFNEEELQPLGLEAIRRYTGKFYPRFGTDWDIILNEVYPVIQSNLPSIFFKTPRAFLKPKQKTFIGKKRNAVSGEMETVEMDSSKSAKTQEAIINYQLVEIKYKDEVRKTLLDGLLFPHGVMWHGYKGDFGMTDEHSIHVKKDSVFVKRVSPMRFIKDPAVTYESMDEGRWVGRIIDMRLEDLKEDDRLDVSKDLKGTPGFGEKVGTATAIDKAAMSGAKNGADTSAITRTSLLDFAEEDFRKSSASQFVRVYEIFLRPTMKEKREGSNGWILLLTKEQDKPLRVNPWSIKAEGFPVKLLMLNPVPDSMLGLSDLETYSSIADQKNVITNLQIRNAQENTKTWVGINKAGADEEDIEKIREGENTIILFDGDTAVGQRMFVANPAGASGDLYALAPQIQRNLEDKSGVSDLKRGFLQSGEESAASVKIRAAGSSARPAYRQDLMADFLTNSVHYLIQLNKQFLPFKKAVRIVGTLDIQWSENPTKEEVQADVDVEIDVISMIPEDPEGELRRYTETLGLFIQGLTDPVVRQKLEQEGKTINLTPLIEQILIRQRIRHPDLFRNITPQESQGFASRSELRDAQANVEAALNGQPPPSPPAEGQDHEARLEVYGSVAKLIQEVGNTIAGQIIGQLMQIQGALLQAEQDKSTKVGNKVPTNSGVRSVA